MSKRYDLGDEEILVTWQEFLPKGKEPSLEKGMIFFPGWPLKKAPVKIAQRISQEFANNSGLRTYTIYTQRNKNVKLPMYHDAKAVCKLLLEKRMNSIILIGFSQGSVKAIDTFMLLREMQLDIQVEAIILLNPGGLNNIANFTFLRRQLWDLSINTWLKIVNESVRQPSLQKKIISFKEDAAIPLSGAGDFLSSIWGDASMSFSTFFSRFMNEVDESTKQSPYLDQIDVPVIIIQGAKDDSFDLARTLTQAKARKLFPHSPYIRLLRAKKEGTHLLPFLRPRAVAQTSLYLLSRYKRYWR